MTSHPRPETHAMANQLQERSKQKPMDLTPDFLGEDRHEFVAKRAYELWEKRGRPTGSPEVDWFAAEQALYSSLLASGLIAGSPEDPQNAPRKMYSS